MCPLERMQFSETADVSSVMHQRAAAFGGSVWKQLQIGDSSRCRLLCAFGSSAIERIRDANHRKCT